MLRPLVVAGPSGVGKGTMLTKLKGEYPEWLSASVSYTSRNPRPNEQNGVDYYFVTKEKFLEGIANNEFVEYAESFGNLYGTAVSEIDRIKKLGKICLLEIDIQGVKQIKCAAIGADSNYVFIAPPSMEELERRLRGRHTESEDKIKQRLEVAGHELAEQEKLGFDRVIVNDSLDQSFRDLQAQICDWYPCLAAQQL